MKTHLVPMHPYYLNLLAQAINTVGEKGLGGRRVNASVQAIIIPKLEQFDVVISPLKIANKRTIDNVEKIRAGLVAKYEGNAERASYDPEWPHLPDPSLSVDLDLAPLHLEHVIAAFAKWCDLEPGEQTKGPSHGNDRELMAIDEILTAAKSAGPKDNAELSTPATLRALPAVKVE